MTKNVVAFPLARRFEVDDLDCKIARLEKLHRLRRLERFAVELRETPRPRRLLPGSSPGPATTYRRASDAWGPAQTREEARTSRYEGSARACAGRAYHAPEPVRLRPAILIAALAGLVALFYAPFAAAAVTLTWTPPTECTSGEPIGEGGCTDLEEYRFQCRTDGPGAPYRDVELFTPAPATSWALDLPPGDYWCRLSVSNAAGFSGWSAQEVFFSIAEPPPPPSKPNAPSAVTVTVEE